MEAGPLVEEAEVLVENLPTRGRGGDVRAPCWRVLGGEEGGLQKVLN